MMPEFALVKFKGCYQMKLLRGQQLSGWSFSKAVRKWRASEIDIAKTTPSVVLSEEE